MIKQFYDTAKCAKCGTGIDSYENILCETCKHERTHKPFDTVNLNTRFKVLNGVWSGMEYFMLLYDTIENTLEYAYAYYNPYNDSTVGFIRIVGTVTMELSEQAYTIGFNNGYDRGYND